LEGTSHGEVSEMAGMVLALAPKYSTGYPGSTDVNGVNGVRGTGAGGGGNTVVVSARQGVEYGFCIGGCFGSVAGCCGDCSVCGGCSGRAAGTALGESAPRRAVISLVMADSST